MFNPPKLLVLFSMFILLFIFQSSFDTEKAEACCGISGMSVDAQPPVICLTQSTTISGYIGLYSWYTIPYLNWRLTISGPASATYTQSGNQIISVTYTPPLAGEYTYTLYAWETRYGTSRTIQKKFYAVEVVSITPNQTDICEGMVGSFTVVTNPPGYEYLVTLSAPGANFSGPGDPDATFSTPGMITVTATCGTSSASTTINVAEGCEVSPFIDTETVSYGVHLAKAKLKQLARRAPMIRDIDLEVEGGITREISEKCCNPCDPEPVKVRKYSGSVSADVTVSLNVPGWDLYLEVELPNIYRVTVDAYLGPTVSLAPSASLGVSGTDDPCEPPACIDVTGSLGIGVTAAVGVTIDVEYYFFEVEEGVWKVKGTVGVSAEISASTNVTGSLEYKGDGCTPSGGSGCVSYGDLKGVGEVSFQLIGWDFSKSIELTFLEGGTWCKTW
jgi:hypothetical protein